MLSPYSLQMKINQRDENWKRSNIANKDESSGKTASPKCTVFINKRQERNYLPLPWTQNFTCACVKERKRIISNSNRKKISLLKLLWNPLKKNKEKKKNSPYQSSLNYRLPFLRRGSQLTNIIAILGPLKGFSWTYLTVEEKKASCCQRHRSHTGTLPALFPFLKNVKFHCFGLVWRKPEFRHEFWCVLWVLTLSQLSCNQSVEKLKS